MKKKTLLSIVATLLLATVLISHYAFAGSKSSSIDPNVVALNNARIGGCWLHSTDVKDYCSHMQSNLGCAPCDDAGSGSPTLPDPPEPIYPPSN